MVPRLFDPLADLAIDVARSGLKASPRIEPPTRIASILRFSKIPARAKDTIIAVLDDDDEFRKLVFDAANERQVGRAGYAFLERREGWQTIVDQLVGALEEPGLKPSSDLRKLERRLDSAERNGDRLTAELADAQRALASHETEVLTARSDVDSLTERLEQANAENLTLAAQRKRAVAELKHTEEVMARHVGERKRLELQLEQMTAAQLNTTVSGGGVTDKHVRDAVDRLTGNVKELSSGLDRLRDSATPERVATPTRTPMPLPPGRSDDSIEVAEYLVRIPGMIVLVDGYNVTKEHNDDWTLIDQREWLYTSLCALAARFGTVFDVVFDGADVELGQLGERDRGVRVRFSPDGVEADDVVIDSVAATAFDRPVTVVSSDRRVRTGAADRGANVLHSHQLISLIQN